MGDYLRDELAMNDARVASASRYLGFTVGTVRTQAGEVGHSRRQYRLVADSFAVGSSSMWWHGQVQFARPDRQHEAAYTPVAPTCFPSLLQSCFWVNSIAWRVGRRWSERRFAGRVAEV